VFPVVAVSNRDEYIANRRTEFSASVVVMDCNGTKLAHLSAWNKILGSSNQNFSVILF